MFTELIKTIPMIVKETYQEAQKFVNLENNMKTNNNKRGETYLEKRKLSLEHKVISITTCEQE